MEKRFLFLILLFSSLQIFANATLPKIFENNMVLQSNKSIPVWGRADANEEVTLQFIRQTKSATADKNGKWKISPDKETAGGPYQFVVKGDDTITFNNVLIGEVRICSGQSNKEFTVNEVTVTDREIAEANYPEIRHIRVADTISAMPENDIKKADWKDCKPSTAPAAKLIRNHSVWRDTQGNPIDCHEGGLLRVGAKYFWYGRSYHGNDMGIYGTDGARFRSGITCYSSGNLVDWTFEGKILSYPDSGWITTGTWHRPRVVFNEKTSKYVLWFFCLGSPDGKFWVKDVVAIADHPAGPFQILGEPKLPIEPSGDLALLVDVDGRGYMANGDWRRNGFVLQLTDDFQNAIGEPVKALPAGPLTEYEGLSLVRFRDKYIFAGSGVAGLNPTETTYAVADSPLGPYTVKGLMSEKKTWRSQLSSFAVISETNTLMALCEQWLIGPDGQPVSAEKSTQLWLPVSFDPKTGTAVMRYLKEWDPSRPQE